jgi:hypothetical protein
METEEVTETLAVLPNQLVIQFKKVGNDIQVHKVKKWKDGDEDPVVIDPNFGAPPDGSFSIGKVVKYIKNPICIGFDIGGSYYEICFDP